MGEGRGWKDEVGRERRREERRREEKRHERLRGEEDEETLDMYLETMEIQSDRTSRKVKRERGQEGTR